MVAGAECVVVTPGADVVGAEPEWVVEDPGAEVDASPEWVVDAPGAEVEASPEWVVVMTACVVSSALGTKRMIEYNLLTMKISRNYRFTTLHFIKIY